MPTHQRIGTGRTAEILAWTPGWVIKLYYPWGAALAEVVCPQLKGATR